jgi:hypothetical protein
MDCNSLQRFGERNESCRDWIVYSSTFLDLRIGNYRNDPKSQDAPCRPALLTRSISGRFAQPNSGSPAIRVDELDARGLECIADNLKGRPPGFARARFQLVHRYDAYPSRFGEI